MQQSPKKWESRPSGEGEDAIMEAEQLTFAPVLPFQPEPIQTLTASFAAGDGTTYTAVIRRWAATSAARCRLCRDCTAKYGADRQAVCVVAIEGGLPEGSAPNGTKLSANLYLYKGCDEIPGGLPRPSFN